MDILYDIKSILEAAVPPGERASYTVYSRDGRPQPQLEVYVNGYHIEIYVKVRAGITVYVHNKHIRGMFKMMLASMINVSKYSTSYLRLEVKTEKLDPAIAAIAKCLVFISEAPKVLPSVTR
jgi:hypothetical protein